MIKTVLATAKLLPAGIKIAKALSFVMSEREDVSKAIKELKNHGSPQWMQIAIAWVYLELVQRTPNKEDDLTFDEFCKMIMNKDGQSVQEWIESSGIALVKVNSEFIAQALTSTAFKK